MFINNFQIMIKQSEIEEKEKELQFYNKTFFLIKESKSKANESPNRNSFVRQSQSLIGGQELIAVIPAYVRLILKKFYSLQVANLQTKLVGSLLISYPIKNLSKQIIEECKKRFSIALNGEQVLLVNDENFRKETPGKQSRNMTYSIDAEYVRYTIRYIFDFDVFNKNMFIIPFDNLKMQLDVSLRDIEFWDQKNKTKMIVKFNCINHPKTNIKMPLKDCDFGEWSPDYSKTRVQYFQKDLPISIIKKRRRAMKSRLEKLHENQLDKKIQKLPENQLEFETQEEENYHMKTKNQINNWRTARFTFELYRTPSIVLATIFIPLLLLGIINISLYFAGNTFKDRVVNTATLLVAYTAFIPTLRQNIPVNPKSTLVQIILYMFLGNALLCLYRSFTLIGVDSDDKKYVKFPELYWNWNTDPLFIIGMCIIIGSGVIITTLFIRHLFKKWFIYSKKQDGPKGQTHQNQYRKQCTVQYNQELNDYFKGKERLDSI